MSRGAYTSTKETERGVSMKVYTCEIFDGHLLDTVMVGVFPTLAKAQEAGGLYLTENADTAHLLDWDHDANQYTDWYQDDSNYNYTRVIYECEVGKRLA